MSEEIMPPQLRNTVSSDEVSKLVETEMKDMTLNEWKGLKESFNTDFLVYKVPIERINIKRILTDYYWDTFIKLNVPLSKQVNIVIPNRKDVFTTLMAWMARVGYKDILKQLVFEFVNEAGIDVGGLTCEVFRLFWEQCFSISGTWTHTTNNIFTLNAAPRASLDTDLFVLGKVLHWTFLQCRKYPVWPTLFDPVIMLFICNVPPRIGHLQKRNLLLYNSFKEYNKKVHDNGTAVQDDEVPEYLKMYVMNNMGLIIFGVNF